LRGELVLYPLQGLLRAGQRRAGLTQGRCHAGPLRADAGEYEGRTKPCHDATGIPGQERRELPKRKLIGWPGGDGAERARVRRARHAQSSAAPDALAASAFGLAFFCVLTYSRPSRNCSRKYSRTAAGSKFRKVPPDSKCWTKTLPIA